MIRSCCGFLLLSLIVCCFAGCGGVSQDEAEMKGTPPQADASKKFVAPGGETAEGGEEKK